MIQCFILDDDKNLVGVEPHEWAAWFGSVLNDDKRTVGYADLGKGVCVSTIFIGVNSMFETRIFGGPFDGEEWRYVTWEDAKAGHEAAVRRASETR